jgi:histidinol-phosphate aminotransferase
MMAGRDIMRSTARGFARYYSPKPGDLLRMDTNTNVLGPNPAAARFLETAEIDIGGYPDTYSDGLRSALADLHGLEIGNIVAGNGSDEMLDVVFKTFTEWGDACAVPVPSYTLYDFFIKVNGGRTAEVPLTDDFQLDVDAVVAAQAKVTIMPSPNNPTGNAFRRADIEEVLARSEGIVVVDEAYAEYSPDGAMISRVGEFGNLVVLRTFSKAYAMAGLRVGYAAAGPELAEMMNCVRIPYSLNAVCEQAAIAAVSDQDFIERSRRMVSEQRPLLAAGLRDLGFEPFPSDANFILARSPADHAELTAGMRRQGILIRDFGDRPRTEGCVRFTVGTADLNARMLEALARVLEEIG